MKDLKHLIYSIINNVYYYDIGNQSEKTNEIINRTDYSNPADWYKLENQLENEICEKNGIKQINEKLNLNMTIYDRQHSTYYGDIDILAKDENSIYIIELKKDVANHSIVGQVLKYALHFQKRLIYNLFNDVKIITIAGSYTNYAFNQLKAIGANTLIYNANNNNLNLTVL
jgi:RecB family endonuclease NucS